MNTAEEAGVAGTPTFFINEVRHRGAYDLDSMDTLVRRVVRIVENRARAAAATAGDPAED